MDKNSLEWQMLNYYKSCEACHKKLAVHAYRKKSHKHKELVRCHCINPNCKMYMVETPQNERDKR